MPLEGYRQPVEDLHLAYRLAGAGRMARTLCGVSTDGMMRQTSFFRSWWEVLCADCGKALDKAT